MLLFIPGVAWTNQEVQLMRWAAEHRYDVTSLARRPDDALALVVDGLADVIVVPTHTKATMAMTHRASAAGVVVDEVRPNPHRVWAPPVSTCTVRITAAARRGASAEAIAAVLGLPLAAVLEVLGSEPAVAALPVQRTGGQRRPRPLSQDGGRR